MARETRTRLNAEVAAQYGGLGAEPIGKDSLAETAAGQQEPEAQLEAEAGEQETEQLAEPTKSLFELPRREPSRPEVVPDIAAPAPILPSSSRKR